MQVGSQQYSVTYSNMGPTPMITVYVDEYSDNACKTVTNRSFVLSSVLFCLPWFRLNYLLYFSSSLLRIFCFDQCTTCGNAAALFVIPAATNRFVL